MSFYPFFQSTVFGVTDGEIISKDREDGTEVEEVTVLQASP